VKLFNKGALLSIVGSERPDRAPLRSAIAAQAQAQQVVIGARKTLERLQAVIDQADDAAQAAAKSRQKVNEARKAWVANGCNFAGTLEIQALEEDAAEKAKAAQSAALNAEAVSQQVRRAKSVLDDATSDVRSRELEIADAMGALLVEEESSLLQKYAQSADELRALRVQVMALHTLVDPWRPHRDAVAPSREGASLVDAALQRGTIQSWDTERDASRPRHWADEPSRDEAMELFAECLQRWRERAQALRENPNA
jgi:hypothetical protein